MTGFLPFDCLLVTNTVLVRKVGQSLREARDSLAEGRSDPFASRDKKFTHSGRHVCCVSAADVPSRCVHDLVRKLAYDTLYMQAISICTV